MLLPFTTATSLNPTPPPRSTSRARMPSLLPARGGLLVMRVRQWGETTRCEGGGLLVMHVRQCGATTRCDPLHPRRKGGGGAPGGTKMSP